MTAILKTRWFVPTVGAALLLLIVMVAPSCASFFLARAHLVSPDHGQLLLVQAVFRHGARTPLGDMYWPETRYARCNDTYKGAVITLRDEHGASKPPPILDPSNPKLAGGCRQGQLTAVGYQMALDFGAWLRRSYTEQSTLLPTDLQSGLVYLRSTCIERARQTLQGVVSGLYPAEAAAQPPQPLVADASLETFEFMYARDAGDAALQALAETVHTQLRLPKQLNVSWSRLHDTLSAMIAEGLPLPPGVDMTIAEVIFAQAVKNDTPVNAPQASDGFLSRHGCDEVLRLALGPLAFRLLDNMRIQHGSASGLPSAGGAAKMAADRPHPRLYLYSGHDSTITPLLAILGTPSTAWPPFMASLVFELWQRRSTTFSVRVLYNKKPHQVPGADADGFLSITAFEHLLATFAVTDHGHQRLCRPHALPTLTAAAAAAGRPASAAAKAAAAAAAAVPAAARAPAAAAAMKVAGGVTGTRPPTNASTVAPGAALKSGRRAE